MFENLSRKLWRVSAGARRRHVRVNQWTTYDYMQQQPL